MNEKIKDSGTTQEFSTGAHRDNPAGKGDCSLLPLREVGEIMDDAVILQIAEFMETNDVNCLGEALKLSTKTLKQFDQDNIIGLLEEEGVPVVVEKGSIKSCLAHMMIEVSKQYQNGAARYGRGNWKLGMPVERYIDSGVRHYLKTLRGDVDEPHYRGFVWNILCAMWTANNIPEKES